MELGNRKNEAKNELKRQDIVIEVNYSTAPPCAGLTKSQSMYNRTMGSLGDLKTEVEEAKWDNMRKSVGKLTSDLCSSVTDTITAALSCFLVLILVGLEFTAVARSRKQKAAEKVQSQSWDRTSSPDPFEAADERNQ